MQTTVGRFTLLTPRRDSALVAGWTDRDRPPSAPPRATATRLGGGCRRDEATRATRAIPWQVPAGRSRGRRTYGSPARGSERGSDGGETAQAKRAGHGS